VKKNATARALFALCRVVVVGDTCISEEGKATIVERDKRYHVCGSAHGSYDAGELIRKHQPDVLLIDPFLEDRDGIRWIKDLATEHPRIRILIGCQGSGWGGTNIGMGFGGGLNVCGSRLCSPFMVNIPVSKMPETCRFRFMADPDNVIKEEDERNNFWETTVRVY